MRYPDLEGRAQYRHEWHKSVFMDDLNDPRCRESGTLQYDEFRGTYRVTAKRFDMRRSPTLFTWRTIRGCSNRRGGTAHSEHICDVLYSSTRQTRRGRFRTRCLRITPADPGLCLERSNPDAHDAFALLDDGGDARGSFQEFRKTTYLARRDCEALVAILIP